ncbi:MAG: hypothetical protein HQK77_17830, partial [Desulfobacterales bacterium]|nr:hypothetical protein [Desulfobacterales bacterium]
NIESESGCYRVAGLDVHKAMVMATLLYEDNQGALIKETQEYKTFQNIRGIGN